MSMINAIARKVFGTQNDRELKSIAPLINKINELEPTYKAMSDSELQSQTERFRKRIANGESLDQLLPEAFATVREGAWRVLGQRHYDVQLIGGAVLHRGKISEMKTGEGKTLVATLASYLNALSGKGVHVITVNDYLARRDAEWMGRLHKFLGLSVGIIAHGLNDRQRQESYAADITYGTNNEFGFDYLRDNMKFRMEDRVQRELNFAIVDEVDSILIDEARTPLIISGPSEGDTGRYYEIDAAFRKAQLLAGTDFIVEEKSKSATFTETGVDKLEKILEVQNLYDPKNIETLHHVNQTLRAHAIFKRDVDYVVQEDEVIIVDEFTGRLMAGRRWSDGLHQAVEAKEGVKIESENQTLATITFQNYFRMYQKLSGMTGTADTEATEFKQIYKLDVVIVPSNRVLARKDEPDLIYKTEAIKFKAILEDIRAANEKGQPVLVGTVSIEKSETLHELLTKENIPHHVLNAKQHEREAEIVAQAGRKGSITISTNMAGRGTDILLGGNAEFLAKREVGNLPDGASEEETAQYQQKLLEANARWKAQCEEERKEVLSFGGLFILGTERHESRRIDNQLRGRAGRQGDPGRSKFFLSLDDDLMRIFGGARIQKLMEDDVPIEHKWITKAIENAQQKVEAHNYDIRKHLLEYDDVMNQQRKVIYAMRKEVLSRQDGLFEMVRSVAGELSARVGQEFFPGGKLKKKSGEAHLDLAELKQRLFALFQWPQETIDEVHESKIVPFNHEGLAKFCIDTCEAIYNQKKELYGADVFHQVERVILLQTIDHLWKEHLLAMDHLREGIGLQGYGQKDPLVEYKKQGFHYFEMMMNLVSEDILRKIHTVQINNDQAPNDYFEDEARALEELNYNVDDEGNLKDQPGLSPTGGPTGPIPPGASTPAQAPRARGGGTSSPGRSGVQGGFQLPAGMKPIDILAQISVTAPDGKQTQLTALTPDIWLQMIPPQVFPKGLDPKTLPIEVIQEVLAQMVLSQMPADQREMILNSGRHSNELADAIRPVTQGLAGGMAGAPNPFSNAKVGRNDPCPCGSGKKFKNCHGNG